MKKYISLICLPILLAGCKPCECEKQAEIKPISWYMEHEKERREKIKECDDNPGKLMNDGNCINTSRAESKLEDRKTGLIKF